jgi:site-specific DNA-methyltransferase (adenine-specific)
MERRREDRQLVSETLTLTPPKPFFESGSIRLYHADALDVLPAIAAASIDALVTDPPYCSGGTSLAERTRDPVQKYCFNANDRGRPSFSGDARDQRSFAFWATTWLRLSRRAVRPDGYAMVFSDWRQLPTVTDALQAAGFIWRGVIAWDKGRASRAPHKGYFRHQCEYVVWGTNGGCRPAAGGPFDGCIQQHVNRADKHHLTGKPTAVMKHLISCVPVGGSVLDLFAGSCTTGVACALSGRAFIGCELSEAYCEIGARRLEAALRGELLSAPRARAAAAGT